MAHMPGVTYVLPYALYHVISPPTDSQLVVEASVEVRIVLAVSLDTATKTLRFANGNQNSALVIEGCIRITAPYYVSH